MGELKTAHGVLPTPFFMPIATKASVKTLDGGDIVNLGAKIILSNTYHLLLRPGEEIIRAAGGLHKFMNWNGAILTDSGGYQIFSLAKQRKITEDGAIFRSHIDGRKFILTPEKALRFQKVLGSDIIMALDVCTPHPCGEKEALRAVETTTDWARRTRKVAAKIITDRQMVFGIVQGSIYKDLRLRSAKDLVDLDFDGYAIGGLAVGEPHKTMFEILEYIVPELPAKAPHYLMGVGQPEEIVEAVRRGVDMFDCVLPTRNARHGLLYVWKKKIADFRPGRSDFYETLHITNEKFKKDFSPPDKNCSCPTCKNYTRSYLRHLFSVDEPLAARLATIHNVNFYLELMEKIRKAISQGKF